MLHRNPGEFEDLDDMERVRRLLRSVLLQLILLPRPARLVVQIYRLRCL